LLLVLLLTSLLPMARIAFFNHSSVDDFRFGVLTRHVWEETHNIFSVLQKALEQTRITYYSWQGSYAALPLFALQPAVFGEQCYWVSFFILIGLYLLAVFSSLRRVWKAFLPRADKRAADSLAAMYCLMTIQLMPFPVQAFYWWNGSVYYFFFHSLFLVQVVNVLVLTKCCEGQRSHWCLLLSSFTLSLVLSGSNYVTALTMLEILALMLCRLFFGRHPARWQMLGVFLATLIGFAVNVLAPGNAVRIAAESSGASAWWAVAQAFVEGWNHILEWTGIPLRLFLAALFWLLWLVPTTKLFARGWMLQLMTVFMVLIYISAFVPSLYAISWKGPGRARNLCFLFWTMSCILAMLSVQDGLRRLIRRYPKNRILSALRGFRPRAALPCLMLCALLLSVDLCVSFLAGDRTRYAGASAIHSLLSGDAAAYDTVIQDRMVILESDDPNPVLPNFRQTVPPLLFFDDITENRTDWRNHEMSIYFHKQSIIRAP
jgi:hypothetical protein